MTTTIAPIKVQTNTIYPNEPAYGIYEGPAMLKGNDGSQTWRWVQDVTVIRNDEKAHHLTDMGAAEDFQYVTPLYMWSGLNDSVAVLQAYAEKNREDFYWQKRAEELLESSTLIRDVIEQEAKLHEVVANRSALGPYVSNQRNGYSRVQNQRDFKERRQAKTGKVVLHG